MKKIIALKGKGNSGKTTTIKALHGLLLQNDYQPVVGTLKILGGDFRAVLIKNGKLIGITSSGDTFDLVHNNLQNLISADCTLCVCACRTSDRRGHGSIAAINSFGHYQKQYVNKTVAGIVSEVIANDSDKVILFNLIESYI